MGKWSDLAHRQRLPVKVLEQIVESHVQHFKHKTGFPHVIKLLKELDQIGVVWVQDTDSL